MEKNKASAGQAKIKSRRDEKELDDRIKRVASEETGLDELNRYEKETGTSSGSMNMPKGRPTQKGGDQSKAMRSVRQMMRSQTGRPEGQKKPADRRQPTGLAPAQKVQRKREAAKKAQDTSHMSSRFD